MLLLLLLTTTISEVIDELVRYSGAQLMACN